MEKNEWMLPGVIFGGIKRHSINCTSKQAAANTFSQIGFCSVRFGSHFWNSVWMQLCLPGHGPLTGLSCVSLVLYTCTLKDLTYAIRTAIVLATDWAQETIWKKKKSTYSYIRRMQFYVGVGIFHCIGQLIDITWI